MLPTESLAGLSSRPSMLIIATDSCLQIPCKAIVRAYPRLDRPRFWTLYLLTSFTKPLFPIGSIHVRTRISGPPTHRMYCIVNAAKSPVNVSRYSIGLVCAVRCYILDVNRTASIPVFVSAGLEDRRGGTNTNVGGSLAKIANWPKH